MSFRHIFLHNFWLKLLSLGLGSLIWLGVHNQIQLSHPLSQLQPSRSIFIKQSVTVPICVITRPGDTRDFKITPQQATATVLGEEAVLRRLSKKDLMIYVDLSEFRSKQPLNEALDAHAPAEVRVSNISPSSVTVEQISP